MDRNGSDASMGGGGGGGCNGCSGSDLHWNDSTGAPASAAAQRVGQMMEVSDPKLKSKLGVRASEGLGADDRARCFV